MDVSYYIMFHSVRKLNSSFIFFSTFQKAQTFTYLMPSVFIYIVLQIGAESKLLLIHLSLSSSALSFSDADLVQTTQ